MRIWSLHPQYLDSKGLVALWRETLLAKKVLEGNTKGYIYHPQLIRFKETSDPVGVVDSYLKGVYNESICRGYSFSKDKINWGSKSVQLTVTTGQIAYEWDHLLNKLHQRDPEKMALNLKVKFPKAHPLFQIIEGKVSGWEVIKPDN